MTSLYIEQLNCKRSVHNNLVEEELRLFMLETFGPYYPGFSMWYRTKVMPGFEQGKRIIHLVKKADTIYGVGILKVDCTTNKLCSFFLLPELRTYGMGSSLINSLLSISDRTGSPLTITVPEEKIKENVGHSSFIDFLSRYGFTSVARQSNRYRWGKYEYVFVRSPQLNRLKCRPSLSSQMLAARNQHIDADFGTPNRWLCSLLPCRNLHLAERPAQETWRMKYLIRDKLCFVHTPVHYESISPNCMQKPASLEGIHNRGKPA